MSTFNVRCRAGKDGMLHLDIPSGRPDSEFDVTLTVEPAAPHGGWSPGFFEHVLGSWQGEFPPLGDEGEFEDRKRL